MTATSFDGLVSGLQPLAASVHILSCSPQNNLPVNTSNEHLEISASHKTGQLSSLSHYFLFLSTSSMFSHYCMKNGKHPRTSV